MREYGKFTLRVDEAERRLNYGDICGVTTYIFGVTGIGKTTLVRNYLGKRKFTELDGNTLTAESLLVPNILDNRKIVVIENLQELPYERHDEITEGILKLMGREDVWLILISRCSIPPWLLEIRLQYELNIIEESKLLFTEELGEKYIQKSGMLFTPEQKKAVVARTKGYPFTWAIAESVYHEIADETSTYLNKEAFARFVAQTELGICQYIEYHVCDQWESDMLDFLTALSIVDSFDSDLAEHITGRPNVEQLIERIKWKGNFLKESMVENKSRYAMIPILVKVLRRRLQRVYKKQAIKDLYVNAGIYFRMKGQLLEALSMYEQVDARNRIIDLLVDNSRIAPGKGYFYELREYYLGLEEEEILDNPYLMEGMCMLQSLLLNPEESEKWYEALKVYGKKLQGGRKREIRSRLLYLDMALLHRRTNFIDILTNADILITRREVFFSEFTLTSNLPSLMNGGKDFCEWSKKDRELAARIGKVLEVVFGKEGKALVNLGLAESFLEKGEDDYLASSYAARGKMQAEAVRNKELIFVADGLMAWLHLLNGQSDVARDYIETFLSKMNRRENPKLIANANTFLTRISLYEKDTKRISAWLETAPNEESGLNVYDRFHFMTKIRAYMMMGKNQSAFNLIMKVRYYGEVAGRTYMLLELKLLEAILLYRSGREGWVKTFEEVLKEACQYHFTRLIAREGAAVIGLLRSITWGESPKEKDFFETVLRDAERVTHYYPGYLKEGQEEVALSENAMKILRYLEQGAKKTVIMKELGMTEANVKYHTAQIYKKLGVNNKTEAVSEARNIGLL